MTIDGETRPTIYSLLKNTTFGELSELKLNSKVDTIFDVVVKILLSIQAVNGNRYLCNTSSNHTIFYFCHGPLQYRENFATWLNEASS